jgi:D-alanine transaminase
MPRYAYVNGSYLPHADAAVHVEDRGFQFADGVYEVIGLINGVLADEDGHLDRLERSLGELRIAMPVPRKTLRLIIRELLRKNRLKNAIVYMQVTRGQARRDFAYPAADTPTSLVITAWPKLYENLPGGVKGIKAITVPDIRWKRRDIKSVALLPQAMAKQAAVEKGAGEALMVDDSGYVTEGSASNAWIVTKQGKLVTRNATNDILKGVTRTALAQICTELQITMEERAFTPGEAYDAAEAFISSATTFVYPVIEIDGKKIGDGKPGAVAKRLYEEYRAYLEGQRGESVRWKAG